MRRTDGIRAAIAAAIVLVSYAPASAQPVLTHVTVISSPSDSGGEVYYAQQRGTFKKYGLDVEIVNLTAGAAVSAAMASGTYDIGQSNVASIGAAHQAGLPFVLVAPGSVYDSQAPTSEIVVAKTSPIKSVPDLVGKSLANPSTRDIGTVALDMLLTAQNVDPAGVRVLEMPESVMADAVQRGTIDGAILIEPYLSAALAAGNVRVLAQHYSAIAPRFMIGAYFARSDWVAAHPAIVRAFASAMAETARWANANHAASAVILSQTINVPIAPNQTRTAYAETLDPAIIQPLLDAAAKTKLMKAPLAAAALLPPP
jgi:NitT/TauT family transport system substrate-binding protein